MRTQEKTRAEFSEKRIFRVKDFIAPNHGKVALDIRGFTVIELFLVVAIIGILATLAIPAYYKVKDLARDSRAIGEIRLIEKAIIAFSIDKNRLPNNMDELGPEIKNIVDPWKHPYVYNKPGTYKDPGEHLLNEDFDLYSHGVDGQSDLTLAADPSADDVNNDDIVRAWSGSTINVVKKLEITPPPP